MLWSQFSIMIFGVNFGNSVLDNFSWDKISYSLTKKSQTCKEGGAHLRISFWRSLMNFEKVEKSDFRKNEKNCWIYHHFTHVYQKPKSYEVQFLWYEVRRKFLAFWAIFCLFNCLHPNNAEKQNFEEMKKAFGDVIILNLCTKKNMIIWFMLTQIWSACTDMFCHFRPFFAFLLNYWPQPLKFGKKCKKHLDILSFYRCVPLIKIIWYMVPEIWSSTDRIFLSSWARFCSFSP